MATVTASARVSSMLQCGAMCCSMLRCVAACFRVLQRCDSERSREHCPRTYTYTTRLSLALATCLISLLYPLLSHANALEHTRIQLLIHVYNSSISCSHDICNLCVLSPSLTRKCARTNTYTTPLSLAFTISIIFLLYPVLSNAKALAYTYTTPHTRIQLLYLLLSRYFQSLCSIPFSHTQMCSQTRTQLLYLLLLQLLLFFCSTLCSHTQMHLHIHVYNSSISCSRDHSDLVAVSLAFTRKCARTHTYTTLLSVALTIALWRGYD